MSTESSSPETSAGSAAAGFLIAGVLVGVIGPLTVAWRYELDSDPRVVGLHFLAFNASLLIAGVLSRRLLRRRMYRGLARAGCLLGSAGFAALALLIPPAPAACRILGLGVTGAAAGVLLTSLLHLIRPRYERRAASTVNFCSLMFGLGCLVATLLLGGMYSVQVRWQMLVLAGIPLVLAPLLGHGRQEGTNVAKERTHSATSLKDLRHPAVLLFSLLLFFQFGNESALAAWLPLFLIHRLGVSPQSAIFLLAVYFFALITGRALSRPLFLRLNHARLLFTSTAAAMFAYLLLSFTESTFGAALATIITGFAFAPIYALVAEKIGHRFDYEPGFFNGIFSVAVTGGMLMPWALGFAGYYMGMQYVLVIPAVATIFVLIIVLLIMLEATVLRSDPDSSGQRPAMAGKAAANGAGDRQ